MTQVLLTHAPEDEAQAAMVAAKLGKLGFKVQQDDNIFRALSPFERRKLAADIDKAACVLVLWSREAAEAPALHAAAARAKASGKLAYARLDVAALPARVGGTNAPNLVNWQGRDEDRGWRQLVANVGAKAKPSSVPVRRAVSAPAPQAAEDAVRAPTSKKKGGGGALLGAILALLAAAAISYYFFVYEGPPLF